MVFLCYPIFNHGAIPISFHGAAGLTIVLNWFLYYYFSIVFGAVAKDTAHERWLYGLKVFAEFMVIGLVLGWLLYFIP